MSAEKDWIPRPMDDFRIFADNFYDESNTNQLAWHLIGTKVAAMTPLIATFDADHDISKHHASRKPTDTSNTEEARIPLEKLIREIGQYEMKHNDFMTNENRTNCGVPNDTGETHVAPVASVSPAVSNKNIARLVDEISYTTADTTHAHAKPDGQQGLKVKIGFYVKGAPIPSEDECTQTDILGDSPSDIVFAEANFGSLYVGYARWFNTRKKLGLAATQFFGVVR